MRRRVLRTITVAAVSVAALAAMPAVDSVAITVSDLDRSVDFYSKVLQFQKISEYEVTGEGYEHLEGVFWSTNSSGADAVGNGKH